MAFSCRTAPTPEARQRRARSIERPSLISIMAEGICFSREEAGERKLGLGIEVRRIGCGAEAALGRGIHLLQQCVGRAELAADEDAVAGLGGAAADGLALRDRSDDGDVGEDSGGRLRDIASGEGDSGLLGGIQQAIEELINPALWKIGGQGEGKKRGEGLAAHGRNVGESAGEAAVADGVGRMPLAAEVHAFQREIGGDESLGAGKGGEHGAIVADGLENAGRRQSGAEPGALIRWRERCVR